MKSYSELLLSWGGRAESIELCKVIAKACSILDEHAFPNLLLYSEASSGYKCEELGTSHDFLALVTEQPNGQEAYRCL